MSPREQREHLFRWKVHKPRRVGQLPDKRRGLRQDRPEQVILVLEVPV
jgi:hypothetical protein